jgi:hypothetical protein
MNAQPGTLEGIAITLAHMKEQMALLVARSEKAATREEVRDGDALLERRLASLEGKDDAQNTRIRALEDANNATASLVSAVKWVLGLGGGGLLAVVVKYLMSSGG